MAKKKPPFEGSRYDNDRGVKEGSKADRKRDTKERAQMKPAMMKGKSRGR